MAFVCSNRIRLGAKLCSLFFILLVYSSQISCVYVKRQVDYKDDDLKEKYNNNDIDAKEIVSKETIKYSNSDLGWHLERQNKFLDKKYTSFNNQTHDCRYSLAIVVDKSASTFMPLFGGKKTNIDLIKNALCKSIERLQGYDVDVALYSFATHSTQETDGYINMKSNHAIDAIKKAIGHAQNWKQDGGSGIKFSENPHDILTNWEDALIKIYETSHHLDKGYVDFVIFITDGNPNTRNNINLHGKTDISAALDQAHYLVNDKNKNSWKKTKIIPISISHGSKEEYIRALTCLPSPQIGQDYFHTKDYDALQEILQYAIEKETCCDKYRDECGVCNGDSGACKTTHFKTWSDIYLDEDFENSYDEHDTVPDKTELYVSVDSIAQQELNKNNKHQLYENSYNKHSKYYNIIENHEFEPMIEKVMFCFSKRGKLLPFDQSSPSHTGCNTKNINIEICVLYHEEKLPHCYTKTQYNDKKLHIVSSKEKIHDYENDYSDSLTHRMTPKQIQNLYNFKWVDQHKKSFKFRARALALHFQSVHVHWKLVYRKKISKDKNQYNNVYKKNEKFMTATKKHHAYLENMDEYDFLDYVKPNGSFNGIFTTHYSIKEHIYNVECIDKYKEESFDLSKNDEHNDDEDDIYYDYNDFKCVFGKRKRLKSIAFNIVLTFCICLTLIFITCLISFINRVSHHRKKMKMEKTDKVCLENTKYSKFVGEEKEEIDHTDSFYENNYQYSTDEEEEFISVLVPEKEQKSLVGEVIDFFGMSEDVNQKNRTNENSKFE